MALFNMRDRNTEQDPEGPQGLTFSNPKYWVVDPDMIPLFFLFFKS